MKNLAISSIWFIWGCTVTVTTIFTKDIPLPRPLAPNEVAVVSFDLEIDPVPEPEKQQGELTSEESGLIPDIKRAKSFLDDAREAYGYVKNPETSPWKAELDSIYGLIEDVLKDSLGVPLLPIEHMRGKVKYNIFGYPYAVAKKTAKLKAADAVLEIRTHIYYEWKSLSTKSIMFASEVEGKYDQKLDLNLTMLNAAGKTIWRQRITVTAESHVVVRRTAKIFRDPKTDIAAPAVADLVEQALDVLLERERTADPDRYKSSKPTN